MIENKKNKGVISLLLEFLEQKKLPYVVLRNHEELPEKPLDGSDVDLLIDRENEKEYLIALKNAVLKSGGFILFKIRQSNCFSCFIYQKTPFPFGTWIDAFLEMSSKSFVFADSKFLLENRLLNEKGFFILPSGGEAATLFVKDALNVSSIREKYRIKILDLVKKDKENFIKTLRPYFSKTAVQEMIQICLNEKWEEVPKKRKQWRQNLILNNFYRQPFNQVLQFFNFFLSQLKKFFVEKGIIIAVIGPDGVGKTTICQKITESMKNIYFSKVYKYHSHPGFFPELGRIYQALFKKSISENNLSQEKRIGFFRAILHLFYYGLENFLTWPWIFWLKTKRSLIIFDRYFYDFIAVNANSKFPLWLFWQIAKVIPRPDLIFVIEARTEEIYKRKKELSLEEIKRRLLAFQNTRITRLAPAIFIDNQEPFEAVLNKAEDEILKLLSKKYGEE